MSMAACKCGALIDTDADPECYYMDFEDAEPMDNPLCQSCKDRAQEQHEALRKVLGDALEKAGAA